MTEDEGEMLLFDRIVKIQSVMRQYGENTFHLSFSGGKDSTVLHHLLDEALPGNSIPREFVNTGIELREIVRFVEEMAKDDKRIEIIKPKVNIRKMLEQEGYPFKSKQHSAVLERFQQKGMIPHVKRYYEGSYGYGSDMCPQILKYQFEEGLPFKVSDRCCDRLKKDPIKAYEKETGRTNAIIGIRAAEGGRRSTAKCMAFKGKRMHFQPLAVIPDEWEDWYIQKRGIKLCKLYYPPYNFERTGCKGCPFSRNLQKGLDVLQKYFPAEREQCEIIWKPVYDEYRRIGYRLEKEEQLKLLE